jgi:hypothetical protein
MARRTENVKPEVVLQQTDDNAMAMEDDTYQFTFDQLLHERE